MMARFYGTVQGGRGKATRLGHATTGLAVTARSYSGDVLVTMFVRDDEDCVCIRTRPHDGGGQHWAIYDGPVAQLLSQPRRKTLADALAADLLLSD